VCLNACAGLAIEVDRLILFVREPYIPVGVLRVYARLHDSYRIAISDRAGLLVHRSHAVVGGPGYPTGRDAIWWWRRSHVGDVGLGGDLRTGHDRVADSGQRPADRGVVLPRGVLRLCDQFGLARGGLLVLDHADCRRHSHQRSSTRKNALISKFRTAPTNTSNIDSRPAPLFPHIRVSTGMVFFAIVDRRGKA
jgi:hypothetical protein